MAWKVKEALIKLAELQTLVEDTLQRSKLTGLYEFIDRNQAYVVNYEQRKQTN